MSVTYETGSPDPMSATECAICHIPLVVDVLRYDEEGYFLEYVATNVSPYSIGFIEGARQSNPYCPDCKIQYR